MRNLNNVEELKTKCIIELFNIECFEEQDSKMSKIKFVQFI